MTACCRGHAHQRASQSHGGGRLAGSGIGSVSGPFVFSPYRNQVGSLSLFSVGRSRRAAKSGRQGPPVSSEPRAGGPPLSSIRARVLTPSVPRLSFRYLFRREDRALLIQHPATGRYLARRALPRRWCAWRWPHRRFAAGLCRGALCKPRRMPRP